MIFNEDDVLYILEEFESDPMSPRESVKIGQMGAHGLSWKIFVKFETEFEIYDKNNPRKKFFMCLRRVWNFGNF